MFARHFAPKEMIHLGWQQRHAIGEDQLHPGSPWDIKNTWHHSLTARDVMGPGSFFGRFGADTKYKTVFFGLSGRLTLSTFSNITNTST
jgi:hypothetical protein